MREPLYIVVSASYPKLSNTAEAVEIALLKRCVFVEISFLGSFFDDLRLVLSGCAFFHPMLLNY